VKFSRAVREIFVNTSISEGGFGTGFFRNPVVAAAMIEANRFLLCGHHLADTLFSPKPDLECVGLQLPILGLLGV
jgi:hypothetical protein